MKKQFSFLPVFTLCLAGSMLFSGCGSDNDDAVLPEAGYSNGVFVTSEGQFLKGNGDVSFFSHDKKTVEPDLFLKVNNRPVGDVVQSMTFHEGNAYILANNSAKIEIADAKTFQSKGVINNLQQPRYMVVVNNKGYVTEHVNYGVPGRVSVIDLTNNTVLKTIPAGIGPERMIYLNNKLYVANSGADFISVINTNTNTVEDSIFVQNGPGSLVLDTNNKIWALSAVSFSGVPGSLHRINPATNAVEFTLPFTESTTAFRSDLKINSAGTVLFYSYANKVYKMIITETALPAVFINRNFYSIGVGPENNIFYGGDARDNATRGQVIMYNANGQATDSVGVGIAPNDFYFR